MAGVTVSEASSHLRLPSTLTTSESDEIARMIDAAIQWAESYCNRAFSSDTRQELIHDFPRSSNRLAQGIYLPWGGDGSITSVKYYNKDYTLTDIDATKYRLLNQLQRTYLFPAMGEQWPTDVADEPYAVEVTYATDEPSSLPPAVKMAILLIVGSLYEYREDGIIDNAGLALVKAPKAAEDLLSPFRTRIA